MRDDVDGELVTTGTAEVGLNKPNQEVFLEHGGSRSYMQPDEARQFAELLQMAADAAEEGEDEQ